MPAHKNILSVFRRELGGYFNSPLAYVFIIIFILFAMGFAFLLGGFIERQEADLSASFFQFHPWLFMILGPAVGMRMWSEENRLGTSELLLTMPISPWTAIVGKFLAACVVLLAGLVLTFPIVITVEYLGEPDYGTIWAGYIGSFLIGAATLSVTSVISAFTRSQVVCLIVSVFVCFLFTLIGIPQLIEFCRDLGLGGLASFLQGSSFYDNYDDPRRGLIRVQNLVYFVSVITFCLFATSVVIRARRA